MKIEKFHVYLADLQPGMGTEPGKTRPVVVVQTDLLNPFHPSTIICPMTSQIIKEPGILKIRIKKSVAGLAHDSDILTDQIRAIDNRRFKKHLGKLDSIQCKLLTESLEVLLLR